MSNICQLCGLDQDLRAYEVTPKSETITICSTCADSIEEPTNNVNHWHCLNESMWSEEPAVQVMAYRLLTKLGNQDLLDMLYLEEDLKAWAEEGLHTEETPTVRDANGNILQEGDAVTIIKDLVVKGAGFTAKQGTTVKNIKMVPNDPTHIQGKVNGTTIFILSAFLKKL
jgi:protein PhnA